MARRGAISLPGARIARCLRTTLGLLSTCEAATPAEGRPMLRPEILSVRPVASSASADVGRAATWTAASDPREAG